MSVHVIAIDVYVHGNLQGLRCQEFCSRVCRLLTDRPPALSTGPLEVSPEKFSRADFGPQTGTDPAIKVIMEICQS